MVEFFLDGGWWLACCSCIRFSESYTFAARFAHRGAVFADGRVRIALFPWIRIDGHSGGPIIDVDPDTHLGFVMWNDAEPTLPGYAFYGCKHAGRRPTHEIGCAQLSENIVALWAIQMDSADGRSKLLSELTPALFAHAPGAALAALNDALCQRHSDTGGCAELGVMLLNRSDHTLAATAAGGFLPVLRTPENQIIRLDRSMTGVPLGMIPSMEYPTQIVDLAPATSVVWISPYTTQITDSGGMLYGLYGLSDQLKAAPLQPQMMLEWITSDIGHFIGNFEQSEDICIMCARRVD